MLETLKGYKSVIFFGLALVVAVAQMFGFGEFEMSAEQLEWFGVIVPLIGLILRGVTNSPMFRKS